MELLVQAGLVQVLGVQQTAPDPHVAFQKGRAENRRGSGPHQGVRGKVLPAQLFRT